MSIFRHYRGVRITFRDYWKAYGGFGDLLRSPYLHLSLALSAALCPFWRNDASKLYDLIMTIVPSVLGFSLGGYAILLAFGDEEFRMRISGADKDGSDSPFIKANGAFVHFIVVSVIALAVGLIGMAWDFNGWFGFLSCALLIYSIACALASAFAIFRVAGWYDDLAKLKKDRAAGS